jgi:VanZ family protein
VLVIYWVAMFTGTHIPQPPPSIDPGGNDKTVHALAFAGLAFLICLNGALRGRMSRRSYLRVILILAVYGAIDEVTQIPIGRSCELADWLADVGGAMSGVTAWAALWALIWPKRRGQ